MILLRKNIIAISKEFNIQDALHNYLINIRFINKIIDILKIYVINKVCLILPERINLNLHCCIISLAGVTTGKKSF